MSSAPQTEVNKTFILGFPERLMFSMLTTIPCCLFLFINAVMLFTLRCKPVFRVTCRYILLYNLLWADTGQLAVSQLMYLLGVFGITLTYPLCGVLYMFCTLINKISPLTLMLMSLDRYVAVCFPLRHTSIVTVRNTELAILAVWAFCFVNIVVVEVVLLLQFPFDKLPSLQMKTFCSTTAMLLTPEFNNYDKAFTCILFVSAGLATICSYVAVIIAARSASTEKASAQRARNTLLLHLVQLGLSLSSTIHNPLLIAVYRLVAQKVFMLIQNIFYITMIISPRCLSSLIYGIRDQSIRPLLMTNLCCQMNISRVKGRSKSKPSQVKRKNRNLT